MGQTPHRARARSKPGNPDAARPRFGFLEILTQQELCSMDCFLLLHYSLWHMHP